MKIKILGVGCAKCKKLEANVKEALTELKMEVTVEKIEAIPEIMSYGVMSMPALVADDKVLVSGAVADVKTIKELLIKNQQQCDGENKSCSSCHCC